MENHGSLKKAGSLRSKAIRLFLCIRKSKLFMTKSEAIKQARIIAGPKHRLFVIFDKALNDFFISEGEDFYKYNNFYESSPYEIIETFN